MVIARLGYTVMGNVLKTSAVGQRRLLKSALVEY
jgi:hypothetical protein